MGITRLERPSSLDEAYRYIADQQAFILGGGAWSRMSLKNVELAVDLSTLDLRYIRTEGRYIGIGAMSTARDVETSDVLRKAFGSVFRDAVSHIVGVQMRNIVSVGGTVAGRYGFSDLNTALLAMDAKVALYRRGKVSLEAFLAGDNGKVGDGPVLIEKILVDIDTGVGAYQSVRTTKSGLPILNAAVPFGKGGWRIAVGARPGAAKLATNAAQMLGDSARPDAAAIAQAASAAAGELSFGDDIRGTAAYRADVFQALVRRAITEATS
ncbi:MAG: FAD binding domain-containing protein [Candidatus Oleimicrobiaceae bacterium]